MEDNNDLTGQFGQAPEISDGDVDAALQRLNGRASRYEKRRNAIFAAAMVAIVSVGALSAYAISNQDDNKVTPAASSTTSLSTATTSSSTSTVATTIKKLPTTIAPKQGEKAWGVFWVRKTPTDANGYPVESTELNAIAKELTNKGYTTGVGDLGCDRGASEAFGLDPKIHYSVVVYFASESDAQEFSDQIGISKPATGIAEVTTFCLD